MGGRWQKSATDTTFAVYNPATGEHIANVHDASAEDGIVALDLAQEAQASWAATAPRTRSDLLLRAYDLVLERTEQFAAVISTEMGKPLQEARGEVSYAADFLRWFAEEAVRINGRYTSSPDGKQRFIVTYKAVGPSLLIAPWNFPLAMATRKIAPALAAGCTVILKPSELTPLTALLFGQVLVDAGVPEGVVSILPTTSASELVQPLMEDPRLRKISFTGSTAVGRVLLEQSGKHVLRSSMELGGNAPLIVFEDADVDAAVEGALLAKVRNAGQVCTSANRFYVHQSLVEVFSQKLAARMSQLVVGPGHEPATQLGPLIDHRAVAKVAELVNDAVAFGARVLTGGHRVAGPGSFFEPTVLVDVPSEARILREEVFGPVAPIVSFSTEQEAIDLANDTEFGLVAYAFTKNIDRGLRLAEKLETGMLGLNAGVIANPAAPFGGVKESGVGREGGAEGIHEYLETTFVGIGSSGSTEL
ncbi:NAD-dependent succinate-semialdehyde dehydrogenase [Glutamicibacter sp. NPDC087344]|uniref:NAD-dependent succinate-semialdehyde dehydrogenase n=1 Tax=Glutamicibacter sp. NPDC087344 TaxID=3363994 RepID=UPI0038111C98